MERNLRALAVAGVFIGALWAGDSALAQKTGGVLKGEGPFSEPGS